MQGNNLGWGTEESPVEEVAYGCDLRKKQESSREEQKKGFGRQPARHGQRPVGRTVL